MRSPYLNAVAIIRRCNEALQHCESEAERHRWLSIQSDAIGVLEAVDSVRLSTKVLAHRIAELTEQLQSTGCGNIPVVICARLNISKSYFYKLKKST